MTEIGVPEDRGTVGSGPRLFPMHVGTAIVYVQQTGPEPVVEADGDIYAASAPSPEEAFEKASEAIRECVRIVGDRISSLAETAKPKEITVEFSLGFEAKGKAHFIPVLFQAEASATTALKVTAVWQLGGKTQ